MYYIRMKSCHEIAIFWGMSGGMGHKDMITFHYGYIGQHTVYFPERLPAEQFLESLKTCVNKGPMLECCMESKEPTFEVAECK